MSENGTAAVGSFPKENVICNHLVDIAYGAGKFGECLTVVKIGPPKAQQAPNKMIGWADSIRGLWWPKALDLFFFFFYFSEYLIYGHLV